MDEDENTRTDFERAQGCLVIAAVGLLISMIFLCWVVIFTLLT